MQAKLSSREVRDLAWGFVLRECGIKRNELLSRRRAPHLVSARALFVWLVKTHGPEDISYPRIAEWLGGMDHTSIMHLYKNVSPRLRERDGDFSRLCHRFETWLQDIEETYHGRTRH